MIVLDTNVLSEPLKSFPNPRVLTWLDAQAAETLFMTTISYAELRFAVLKMPDGKRKNDLAAQIKRVLEVFKDRTLEFNVKAAEHLARIAVRGEQMGKTAMAPDAYIAAIASAYGFGVATRNVRHFEHTGISISNPWE
jgi:predicted nucleic acid-binding protein